VAARRRTWPGMLVRQTRVTEADGPPALAAGVSPPGSWLGVEITCRVYKFGTDYLEPGQAVGQIDLYREIDISAEAKAKICRENARRVLGL